MTHPNIGAWWGKMSRNQQPALSSCIKKLTCSNAELQCQDGHASSNSGDQDILTLLNPRFSEHGPAGSES